MAPKKNKEASKPSPKNVFPMAKHVINEAFTCGDVTYYEFDTTANLPWKRGLKFLSIYNELDMKCDRYYLQKHVEATEKLLTGGPINLSTLAQVLNFNNQLKERLQMVYHEDLVYKLASVVFFDANENPDDWEWQYAMRKIEHWKKHEDAATFFLHQPVQRLIPFLNAGNSNLSTYLQTAKQVDEGHLANLLQVLSKGPSGKLPSVIQRYFAEEMKQSSMQSVTQSTNSSTGSTAESET